MRVQLVDFSFVFGIYLDLEFHIKEESCIVTEYTFIQISKIRVSECDKLFY